MDVAITGSVVSVTGTVLRHQTPTDPASALTTQAGPSLTFSAALGVGALTGVDAPGKSAFWPPPSTLRLVPV